MRFPIDARLPIALARFVRQRGGTATHVADAGMAAADNSPVWDRTIREAEVVVTKDEDFASVDC